MESSQAGESTGQEADVGGMMPDAPGGQDGNYPDPQGIMGSADGDNVVVVDSVSTTFSEETSSVISVTAAVPEHFGLSAYAEIISVESGVTYSLPLYASNGYYQYTASAVRENSQPGYGLFIFLAVAMFGGLGYAAYTLDRKLKALLPKEDDYRIRGRWTE